VDYWFRHIASVPAFNPDVEWVAVIALNCQYRPTGHQIVSVGTLTEALIHAREVFRAAIVASAYSIVVMHNHPSGDPAPSQGDIQATRRLKEAAEILQIGLRDHVIVGRDRHFSFRNEGMLNSKAKRNS
jgi:DNA repair protein RadC